MKNFVHHRKSIKRVFSEPLHFNRHFVSVANNEGFETLESGTKRVKKERMRGNLFHYLIEDDWEVDNSRTVNLRCYLQAFKRILEYGNQYKAT